MCVLVKWTPFPASGLAWTVSGLAPPVRARRPILAHPPLCASIKSRLPSRFSFFLPSPLHTLAASSLQHGSAPLPWPFIADRRVTTVHESTSVDRRVSTVHEAHRPSAGHGSLASPPVHSHPVFGVNGRSTPSNSLSPGSTTSLQRSSNGGCSLLG